MKKILVIGSAGQIGSELVPELRRIYGTNNVVASDIQQNPPEILLNGPYEIIDCLDAEKIKTVIKHNDIDTVYNLAALLSSIGERNPQLSWKINIGGLMNLLELATEFKFALFTPSSIGAFGPTTPHDNTPQDTIMRPTSMYGVTKVAGELLCDYYHLKFGVDARGVRYPGIISNVTLPGGGTTDYAVDIYYKAILEGEFTCNLKAGTYLDMMYMPDCLRAAIELMEADPAKLIHRNCYNVAAMSFEPEEIAAEIRKHIPEFKLKYDIDPVRQAIADSWPNKMDDSVARSEWNWQHEYNLPEMTVDMLNVLRKKLKK
ncbi:MAG: L-threonine 3-dehydrogenase [Candidatus Cloacimonetes bacterium]|nr:L-threonine 3-dehydrogenase [Candidatus Cloacimonadota bacterium]